MAAFTMDQPNNDGLLSKGLLNALAMSEANSTALTIDIHDGSPLSEAFRATCTTYQRFASLQTSTDMKAIGTATDAHGEAGDAFDALLNAMAAKMLDTDNDPDVPLIDIYDVPVEEPYSECIRAYNGAHEDAQPFVAACARFNAALQERISELSI